MPVPKRSIAVAAASLLLLFAVPAAAQREVNNPPDPWIHTATGTRFPETVGEFQRGRVTEYSEDGHDASAGYKLSRGGDWAVVTFYIYPTVPGLTCQATFDDVKRHVQNHPGARLVSESREPAPSGRGSPVALRARYALPERSIAKEAPAVGSEAYLYCPPDNEWLVKYRATWTTGADFAADVEKLLHSIEWPTELGG